MTRNGLVILLAATPVVLLAFDGGGYDLVSRSTVAIGVWFLVAAAVASGLVPFGRPPVAAAATATLLAGFAAWTGASIAWAENEAKALAEFNRVTLYLGLFVLALLIAALGRTERVSDGLALGISGVGVAALASRLFPDLVAEGDLLTFLPGYEGRLFYPLGYPNALSIFIALGLPLLLRAAVASASPIGRGLAVLPIPALAGAMYLTSSRGGALACVVGVGAFLTLTHRRWAASGALAVGAAGSAAVLAVLANRPELVDDPTATVAESQGRDAALLVALICLTSGLVWGLGSRVLRARYRPSAALGWAVLGAIVIAGAIGVAAANPAERFEEFKRTPGVSEPGGSSVRAHLLSGNSTGRWQNWQASVEQFRRDPVTGGGAGSYAAWWAEHATILLFVLDAHSLYFETLGELGAVGLFLLLATMGVGLAAGLRHVRGASEQRTTVAGFVASFLAFAFAAGIDWMWEMTVVGGIAFVCLGLAAGTSHSSKTSVPGGTPRRGSPLVARVGVGLAALALVVTQALPAFSALKLTDSEAAAAQGDVETALADALDARSLEPWSPAPYIQLALVAEQARDLRAARRWLAGAIRRDRRDWRSWLVAARLELRSGNVAAGRKSLARARALNPRSPLFPSPQPP